MCRGKGKLSCNSPNTRSRGHAPSWGDPGTTQRWGRISLPVVLRPPPLCCRDHPSGFLALQESPDPVAMGGLLPREKKSLPGCPPTPNLPPHGLREEEADVGCVSHGVGGQREANLPPNPLPPAAATLEAANGTGSCWGWFVFPSPGINPWQIRGTPGEQTRPGQGRKHV